MRINIWEEPAPIRIGEGEAAFSLKLKRFTATERAAIWDAVASRRYAEVQAETARLIVGWEDVLDENGRPIPFNGTSADGKTTTLEAFLGRITPAMQGRVMCAILAFIGIPTKDLDSFREAFEAFSGEKMATDPTERMAPATGGSASTS